MGKEQWPPGRNQAEPRGNEIASKTKNKGNGFARKEAVRYDGPCNPNACPYFARHNIGSIVDKHINLLIEANRLHLLWKQAEDKNKELEERWWEEKQKRQKLETQLAKYQEKLFKPNKKTCGDDGPAEETPSDSLEEKSKKKRGAKFGHPGKTREKPATIDTEIEVSLEKCPLCGETGLRKMGKVHEHIQEDIIIPAPAATRYIKHLYYCPRCKSEVRGMGENEIPNAYIGPVARALAATLRYETRVPYRQVEKLFSEAFGLKLTPGALVGFDHKLTSRGRPWYEFLKNHVKNSPHIHADETGWRSDGINHYLWIFTNARLALYHIDRSRGSKVPLDILGEKYPGILISDCYVGYNPVKARMKQKCVAHLLDDNSTLAKTFPDDIQLKTFTATFKDYMRRALALQKQFRKKEIKRSQLNKSAAVLKKDFWEFMDAPLDNKDAETFRKRNINYKKEIFTFLEHTSVDATNNRAERGLRPNVILRKVTFGNRSDNGKINHETLMSLIQTAKLNGTRPLTLLTNLAAGCDDAHFRNLLIDLEPVPT